jgi:uncharacterized protein YndB with AHSA1/START domain
MNDFGLITDNGTIRFERLFPGPAERVWDHLTKSEHLASWLACGEVQLRRGGYVELSFEVIEGTDRVVAGLPVNGVVTRCHPPDSLAFTWTDANTMSRVAFELERRHSQVHFLLTHADLPLRATAKCCASWHAHLNILRARLCSEQTEPFATGFRQVFAYYERQRDARLQRAKAS